MIIIISALEMKIIDSEEKQLVQIDAASNWQSKFKYENIKFYSSCSFDDVKMPLTLTLLRDNIVSLLLITFLVTD